ncbi:ABC transporter permease [Natrialba swarupiae]|uniref:ABC transporter permease n=1 Tax=Natrialba swarupiae TaxID=2448032 RepID=A0A5D5AU81_9EURY|nr:ABC transporter permease [Natrialba swarupiae]TYT62611.1 ABC transporter permease [Natrialba swarupiae]
MVGNNITNRMSSMRDRRFFRSLIGGVRILISDKLTMIYLGFISFVLLLAVIGPLIVPYGYNERIYGPDGEILFSAAPTLAHPLGTTDSGYDVLSRIVYGARPTVVTGMVSGFMIFSIGMTIGVVSGYVGGRVGNILMRFTDLTYSIPLIPFALVVVAIFGSGFYVSIVIIGAVLWRGLARVIRSQVLQIKERPFILAAKTSGASTPYIIFKHVLPNVAPMGILFLALGTGYAIVIQAGLAFLGVTDPFVPSWGIMVRNAYESGMMSSALWWSLPPGFLISITVLSLFMLGRRLESQITQNEESMIAEAG